VRAIAAGACSEASRRSKASKTSIRTTSRSTSGAASARKAGGGSIAAIAFAAGRNTLIPTPQPTCATSPATRETHRMPATLRFWTKRSFGQRNSACTADARVMPSATHSATQNGTAHKSPAGSVVGRIVVNKSPVPAVAIQERPALRPRPAVCSSATKVVPKTSLRASNCVASSLVDPVSAW
jgi:hypothetical protein